MAQHQTGLRSILSSSAVYSAFQHLIGAHNVWQTFIKDYMQPTAGQRILDIGCGPGDMLDYLPQNTLYTGIDVSAEYIDTAKKKRGDRGAFFVGSAADLQQCVSGTFDWIVAVGVLHHLDDDEVDRLLSSTLPLLCEGASLVTLDPVFTTPQNTVAKFLIERDRGLNVRAADLLQAKANNYFGETTVYTRTDLLRIPYSHVALVCRFPIEEKPQ